MMGVFIVLTLFYVNTNTQHSSAILGSCQGLVSCLIAYVSGAPRSILARLTDARVLYGIRT